MARNGIELHGPGSDVYRSATTPMNAIADQRPAFVSVPADAEDVAATVREAARRNLRVVPQATGHGAAGTLGDDVLLLWTTALDRVSIDGDVATIGAGARWSDVNAAAWQHGLLGRAGSAPTVAVAGYTFGAGVGWLARPFGPACGALRQVEYVDGAGRVRIAREDAADPLDREALWAFRGGGGVGVAVTLEIGLQHVDDLWAGYLLWPADALQAVCTAWADTVEQLGDAVTTSIATLQVPPVPAFPERLRGEAAVHLAIASSAGPQGAAVLLDAVRAAAEPVVDTWGPSDAARLGGIHLDPSEPGPALGYARWLGTGTPGAIAAILGVGLRDGSPLVQIEVRNVAALPSGVDGAQTVAPAPYILHAVGIAPDDDARTAVGSALEAVRAASADVDAGRTPASWVDDATAVPDALSEQDQARAARIADAIDPSHRLHRSTIAAGARVDARG